MSTAAANVPTNLGCRWSRRWRLISRTTFLDPSQCYVFKDTFPSYLCLPNVCPDQCRLLHLSPQGPLQIFLFLAHFFCYHGCSSTEDRSLAGESLIPETRDAGSSGSSCVMRLTPESLKPEVLPEDTPLSFSSSAWGCALRLPV